MFYSNLIRLFFGVCSLADPADAIQKVCGDDIRARCKRVWGLDEECEINGTCRDLGVPGLWYIMGKVMVS
jgi:hypothetical protein